MAEGALEGGEGGCGRVVGSGTFVFVGEEEVCEDTEPRAVLGGRAHGVREERCVRPDAARGHVAEGGVCGTRHVNDAAHTVLVRTHSDAFTCHGVRQRHANSRTCLVAKCDHDCARTVAFDAQSLCAEHWTFLSEGDNESCAISSPDCSVGDEVALGRR